jgi:hypothetical protein
MGVEITTPAAMVAYINAHEANVSNPHAVTIQQAYASDSDGNINLSTGKSLDLTYPNATATERIFGLYNGTASRPFTVYADGHIHINSTGSFRSGGYIGFGDGGDTTPYAGIGEIIDDELAIWGPDIVFREGKSDTTSVRILGLSGVMYWYSIGVETVRMTPSSATLAFKNAISPKITITSSSNTTTNAGEIVMTESDVNWGFKLRHNASADSFDFIRMDSGTERVNYRMNFGENTFNVGANDVDFKIKKLTSGDAYVYDAGLDRHTYSGESFSNLTFENYTGGGNRTITKSKTYYNPASIQAAVTLTLPSAPPDGTERYVVFGGTVAFGADVVTSLTISAAQTVFASFSGVWKSGDNFTVRYNATLTRWEKI